MKKIMGLMLVLLCGYNFLFADNTFSWKLFSVWNNNNKIPTGNITNYNGKMITFSSAMQMYISDDSGINWQEFPTNTLQDYFHSAITKNPDELLIMEHNILGLDSVKNTHYGDMFLFSFNLENQTLNCISGIPDFGSIYTFGINSLKNFYYDFVSSKTGIFSVKDTNDIYSIYLTDDSLQTWNKIYSSKYGIYSVVMTSANNIGFIGIDSNANFFYSCSEDKGANWQRTYLPEADTTQMNESYCVSNIHLYFYDENLGFILGYIPSNTNNHIVLKTTDGGKYWNIINTFFGNESNPRPLTKLKFLNTDTMMAFSYPHILLSTNCGGGMDFIT
jgi:hypothetical protein